MSLANASHENHPYSQYKGLQVQGCEENHEKPTAGNKGKNIALTALESPATRAWVNSCSKAAKSDSKAANGSASQWLQGTVQEQNVFWLDISLFQNLEKQKQQKKKPYQIHCLQLWKHCYLASKVSKQQMFVFSIKLNWQKCHLFFPLELISSVFYNSFICLKQNENWKKIFVIFISMLKIKLLSWNQL